LRQNRKVTARTGVRVFCSLFLWGSMYRACICCIVVGGCVLEEARDAGAGLPEQLWRYGDSLLRAGWGLFWCLRMLVRRTRTAPSGVECAARVCCNKGRPVEVYIWCAKPKAEASPNPVALCGDSIHSLPASDKDAPSRGRPVASLELPASLLSTCLSSAILAAGGQLLGRTQARFAGSLAVAFLAYFRWSRSQKGVFNPCCPLCCQMPGRELLFPQSIHRLPTAHSRLFSGSKSPSTFG
jgi:hypothetical protein